MLNKRSLTFGNLSMTMYDFEFVGDNLPYHSHATGETHITICVRGEVNVVTPEWTKTIKEGNIIEFYPKQTHSIVALVDNCRILNIPMFYDKS